LTTAQERHVKGARVEGTKAGLVGKKLSYKKKYRAGSGDLGGSVSSQ